MAVRVREVDKFVGAFIRAQGKGDISLETATELLAETICIAIAQNAAEEAQRKVKPENLDALMG